MRKTAWPTRARMRRRTYAALACAFFVLAVATAAGKATTLSQRFDLAVSDGRYYYAYLPSVVIDGDLDFTNQIAEHWGPDFRPELLADRTPIGRVRNKFPIGLALTLSPGFLLGHLVALISWGAVPADGYSWPYQIACLAMIEFLVWRTLVRIDQLMIKRLRIPGDATLAGLLVLALGTPYAYYACREPFMVHVVSAFWCMEVVAAAAAGSRGPGQMWLRLAFCGSMAVVCRPTNVHLIGVAGWGVMESVGAVGWRRTFALLPLAGVALVPIGLQLLSWRLLGGQWLYFSYQDEGFDWGRPALWQTLFSSRHGLFFWSPIMLIAVAALLLRLRAPLIRAWSLGLLLLWYANSAWHCWWFGDAFGPAPFSNWPGCSASVWG